MPRLTQYRPGHHVTGESIAFAKPPTYALELRNRGTSYQLVWVESPAPVPGPGQVAIAVRAVGLNYLDVLLARGVIGEDAVPGFVGGRLGADCAGVASGVGPGVSGLVPGDRVCAFAPGSFASNVVTSAGVVAHIPPGMNFSEAATLPSRSTLSTIPCRTSHG